jgi:hypothetical protein
MSKNDRIGYRLGTMPTIAWVLVILILAVVLISLL